MCGILCLIQYNALIHIEQAQKCLNQLTPRGPDKENYVILNPSDHTQIFMGFRRLSIMDTSDAGLQPFERDDNYVICNGEIYEHHRLAETYGITTETECDCEIILPLYEKVESIDIFFTILDAEFAMVIYDKTKNIIIAARDRYGVRPLFYGYDKKTRMIGFSSEMKALHSIMEFVAPVIPNQIMIVDLGLLEKDINDSLSYLEYYDYYKLNVPENPLINIEEIYFLIRDILTRAVKKRLISDRKIGFLLSGGLDSSLIVAIASKIIGPENMVCFSIGLEDSSDVVAAKKVCQFLEIKNHHVIPIDIETAIGVLPEVIHCLESYDITTIRASTPQYLMAKYIRQNTDIKVLLSGEGADEICGSYRYFRNAPSSLEFHQETINLLRELYMFDNLRTDRTMASGGLEVRVPFLDFEYVELIKKIDPSLLMFRENWMEKQLVRDSFLGYLPGEILMRSKEAFSDAINTHDVNWFRELQTRLEIIISDDDLLNNEFTINKPETKESLYYRRIYGQLYDGRDNIIAHYWLPKWQKEHVTDPSATVLKCY